ncbi:carbamate kinase [Enterococcus gallinarum]|uniref:Carbamate kinase n=1 Tax=Enterococcus gallinarum TaxID=1353 RepID=A0A376H5D4_ENTGA|nr:carbamate kinase [Enterococcus gallinarum]MCC4044206.1 carbamate kinase [Enterococcus gallinarum]OJG49563.1 carbamate kinase [Enterococcus gallinarum]STD85152.1 carbamate kinase [Enterococcus gallinarum]STD87620.1 carbamate kinase [Enterococcus gallinarum]
MTNKRTVVIALGGNAILTDDPSARGQQQALRQTAKHLVALIKQEIQVVITHGNGPQVGNLLLQQQAANSPKNPAMPLDTCVAMTQGSIGYWLQNALEEELAAEGLPTKVATLVTQVVVSEKDPAFADPTKPVGPFLTEEQAQQMMTETNAIFKEDAGRGWRKVVASPKPIAIHDQASIRALVDNDFIVICAGGGGIPVTESGRGVEAVIDKDFASEKLAEVLEAEELIILTGVSKIALNYGKDNEQWLDQVNLTELEQYIQEGHFAPGSMLPKVQAAMDFVQVSKNNVAIITSLEDLADFDHETGTRIISD